MQKDDDQYPERFIIALSGFLRYTVDQHPYPERGGQGSQDNCSNKNNAIDGHDSIKQPVYPSVIQRRAPPVMGVGDANLRLFMRRPFLAHQPDAMERSRISCADPS
jgi:hypothetical protein